MDDGGAPSSRRDEILEQAFELVREAGLTGLTMKKVAERVGVTEPALYRHFPTKQAILVGIAQRLTQKLLGPIRAIAAEEETPPEQRVERILTHHFRLVLETNGLPFLLMAEASVSGDQDVADTLGGAMLSYQQIMVGILEQMPRSVEMPEPRHMLPLLVGVIAAVAIQRRALPRLPVDPNAVLDLIPYLVRRLTRPEPAESPEPGEEPA